MARTAKQFTGWHMFAICVAFFGVIIAVNSFMAWSAVRSWTGLVVANSYVASQEFQIKQDLAQEQQELGWAAGIGYVDGVAQFMLRDAEDKPIELGGITIALSRPIGDRDDQTLPLVQNAEGGYSTDVALKSGAWNAVVIAETSPHGRVEYHGRIVAP